MIVRLCVRRYSQLEIFTDKHHQMQEVRIGRGQLNEHRAKFQDPPGPLQPRFCYKFLRNSNSATGSPSKTRTPPCFSTFVLSCSFTRVFHSKSSTFRCCNRSLKSSKIISLAAWNQICNSPRHSPFPVSCSRLILSSVDVLVIGAGPTGLGAAKRLHQLVCYSHVNVPKY